MALNLLVLGPATAINAIIYMLYTLVHITCESRALLRTHLSMSTRQVVANDILCLVVRSGCAHAASKLRASRHVRAATMMVKSSYLCWRGKRAARAEKRHKSASKLPRYRV